MQPCTVCGHEVVWKALDGLISMDDIMRKALVSKWSAFHFQEYQFFAAPWLSAVLSGLKEAAI